MKYPQGRIMVFCKAPEPGRVMTRLAGTLTSQGLDGNAIAVEIHKYLTIERLKHATKENLAPVEMWCSPNKTHPFFKWCENRFPIVLKDQSGGDLGHRMASAFNDALSTQTFAVLIGTDCPGLHAVVIRQACESLSTKKTSVLVPAEDGGYVLVGLSRLQAEIFQGIAWGSDSVFDETCKRLEGEVDILPCLWDIDRLNDLMRLKKESGDMQLNDEFIRYLDSIKF